MATSRATTQYSAGRFVMCGGSVLFRRFAESDELQACVLHNIVTGEHVLPKGRKDYGEAIEAAAIRETFEETGYPCELVPLRMPTRAPEPGVNRKDAVAIVDGICEPIVVTIRDQGERGVKIIWWYVTQVKRGVHGKLEGTQTETEQFDSIFVGVQQAISLLTFQSDRDVVMQALELVQTTESASGNRVVYSQTKQ